MSKKTLLWSSAVVLLAAIACSDDGGDDGMNMSAAGTSSTGGSGMTSGGGTGGRNTAGAGGSGMTSAGNGGMGGAAGGAMAGGAGGGGAGGGGMMAGGAGGAGMTGDAALDAFVANVQPILLQRCTGGFCHDIDHASMDAQVAYNDVTSMLPTGNLKIVAMLDRIGPDAPELYMTRMPAAEGMRPACDGPPGSANCVTQAEYDAISTWYETYVAP